MINLQSLTLLKANLLQANRAGRLRLARSVAYVVSLSLGIGLFIGISPLKDASIKAHPKEYIRSIYSKEKALCLIKLYGKESAFNRHAVGNLDGKKQAYGIPQLKSEAIRGLSAVEQINYGIRYINHRKAYQGDPCLAYAHYLDKGWH